MMQNKLKTRKIGILAALLFAVAMISCQENDATISQEIMDETAFAENVFAQLSSDVEDAIPLDGISNGRNGFGGFGFGFGKCMTRKVETPTDADYPKVITIEYDGQCSSGLNAAVKTGKIIVTLTGPRNEVGSKRIVTFEDFSINDNQVKGTKTYTYSGNGQSTVMLENGNILSKDGDVIIRESVKTRTLVEGADTDDRSDDVYKVTGEILGEVIDAETGEKLSYSKEIDSENPLIVAKDCFWITQGTITTTIGNAISTIDFGDGSCDNLAIRTDENGEEEFEMELRIRKMWRHKHKNSNK